MVRKLLKGTISLGGDKSLSHRAVLLAAMASGRSVIGGVSSGADVASTCEVFRGLGVEITHSDDRTVVSSNGRTEFTPPDRDLNCGNSGTTMRLCTGIFAGSKITARLVGDESLSGRPMSRIVDPLRMMGASIDCKGEDSRAPLVIKGSPLRGISYQSPVASAQVKSALLLAGLSASGTTAITEPEKSRDHTERLLQALGCNLLVDGLTVSVEPCQTLPAFEYNVPADASTAVVFAVAASILEESEILLKNVLLNPTRTGGFEILSRMGAEISFESRHLQLGEEQGDIIVKSTELSGADSSGIATATFIDEIPILAVAAASANGETDFHNVGELRVKESDRLQGIIDLLRCYNITAIAEHDDLKVQGGEIRKIAPPDHKGDHRLAMAAEILNLKAEAKLIGGFEAIISISAPEFYPQLRAALQ